MPPKRTDVVPALAAPTGNVIRVSNESQLQAAVRTMESAVLIAPGTHRLTSTLNIGNRPLKNVAVASGDAGPDWDGEPRSGIPDIGADERPSVKKVCLRS